MKKLWEKYCAFSRAKQIAVAVFLFHGIAIFSLCVHHLSTWKRPPKQRISVRTVRPMPSPTAVQKLEPQKTSPSARKKETRIKPAAKKTSPAKTTAPLAKKGPPKNTADSPKKTKPAVGKAEESLLKEIAESLDIIASDEPKAKHSALPALSLPAAVRKAEHAEPTAYDVGYGEALAAYLQSALELPEYGEVKAELKIGRNGDLISLNILESRNRKNEEFLKKQLQELPFPCLNDFGISDESFTACIIFKNVENP